MLQRIKNIGHLLIAITANFVYGFPSKKLRVLAITGTDGKTTTSTLLYHILQQAGKQVALISTVAAFIGNEEIDTGFHVTNPSSFALQKLLARIVKNKIEFVVIETTSHGIDQNRNWGITPQISAITNITHEHLDYHKTYERYLLTKAKLLTHSGRAILNKDHELSFSRLHKIVKNSGVEFVAVSTGSLPSIIVSAMHKRFEEQSYNFENTAIAYEFAKQLGINDKTIAMAIRTFPGVKGRMEVVSTQNNVKVVVDFAHTPNALERALKTVRAQMQRERRKGKLIVVFGCAGQRDVTKRPLMGDIATRLADLAIFTAEDPRTEDVWTIINQMKSGIVRGHDKVVSVSDRGAAIRMAIKKMSKPGDVIIITGKGHERSMCIGRVEHRWSDQETVLKTIDSKLSD